MSVKFPKVLNIEKYFVNPIWISHHEDKLYLNKLNKVSDKYINESKKIDSKKTVFHSKSLINIPEFKELQNYIIATAQNLLIEMGYDLKTFEVCCTELWVQEFNLKGGGHHNVHTHWNGHISGFYFLKSSDTTSKPVFHDPRPGAVMNLLPELDKTKVTYSTSQVEFKPKPGTIMFFPSYLPHEYTVDLSKKPFRFIHFNCQALPRILKEIK
jgi:uncharacterized protein (TIGR02466 family)|tara:strand:+ start:657 stop:1292 length:636 start_codon:yes stop_codon:yes gene_type:complete